jgi:cbb3-type cytochrome oxidase subunit 3
VHVSLASQAIQASRGPGDPASRIPGIAVLVVLLLIVIAGVASIVSPRWRRRAPRAIGLGLGGLVAAYLAGRGIAEFWLVDYSSPASYRHAWGGPTLAGVFAVHSGPGLIILIAMAVWLYRRRQHASTG